MHQNGKFADAAKLFEKAESVNASESLFSYNLACAYARANDARWKDALDRAIKKGGDAIKTRAKSDKDFSGVQLPF